MEFKGKAIYNPAGKAAEYSKWACNFYVGCSNGCEYCYCKKGLLKGVMGQDMPQLKKCFNGDKHALQIFEKELLQNKAELQKHGLFFSFTTDPMLSETFLLTLYAIQKCDDNNIPVYLLTKQADFYAHLLYDKIICDWNINNLIIGYTLTGHDELEPYASTNFERIKNMKKAHNRGFKTFASLEPVIDVDASFNMILYTKGYCDYYKIGLLSGKKYDKQTLINFVSEVLYKLEDTPVYFKDSLLKQAGIERSKLPANCVTRDFKLHDSESRMLLAAKKFVKSQLIKPDLKSIAQS